MGSEGVQDILKFLFQGDKMIRYSPSQETVLVLGDTGTGKTTLTHFLASNNDNMVSVAKGRGDYIIKDNTKDICDSTIDSCTVIPELIIDKTANNTAYYDCPGFSDTRSVSHDIGVTYFIQKVVQRVNSVKIIFSISYDSVRQGGDRRAFMNLAKNIQSMFRDINKFEKSVCLVVTKVDNIVEDIGDDTYKLVPDDVMIQNIVGFLEEAKNDLSSKMKTALPQEDKKFYQSAVSFINIITNDKETKAPKIGIFRRPNKEGPVSKMPALKRGKAELQKMIYQQLVYTLCDQTDFGYTISDNSKLHLNALKEGINENIQKEVSKMGQQLLKNYSLRERRSEFIDDLINEITIVYNDLSALSSANDQLPRDFIKKTTATLNKQKVEISTEHIIQIKSFSGYLEFIQSLMRQSASQPMQYGYGLKDVVRYLNDSLDWYRLLMQLRATLSQYTIQQNVAQYNDIRKKLLFDIASHNGEGVLASLKQLLSKVNEGSGMQYEIPTIEKLDETKLKFLKDLMLVFAPSTSECTGNKLVVKGNIVKMTDVVSQPCYSQSETVEVFGLSKVYFDTKVDKKGGLVRVFSPEYSVVTEQSLIVDGPNNDYIPGKQGELGKPGVPGNPGGSAGGFVGIGQVCTNCNKLSISAVGGKGGRGQEGGDGVPGRVGETAMSLYWRTCDPAIWRDIFVNHQHFQVEIEQNDCYGINCNLWREKVCIVTGRQGRNGGTGGDGGRGGEGGLAGQVSLLFSDPLINGPSAKISKGQVGVGGGGGRGGPGGRQGDTLRLYSKWGTSTTWRDKCSKDPRYETSKNYAPKGANGKDNYNAQSLRHPNIVNFDPSQSISHYKNFLRGSMGNSMNNEVLKSFLEYIEVDQKVNGFYESNIKDYVDDLIVMENQVYSQSMSSMNVHSYKNFLLRITKFARDLHNQGSMSDDSRLVLGYLYASILSKICRIQDSAKAELVIDIKGYLKWVKEDTKQLEDFKNTVEKNKNKSNYQKIINAKIDEANNLINEEILPEIDNTIQQLKGDMQSLLDETITLENEARANEVKLIDYRNKLESQMVLSTIFGVFQGIGQAVGFLGPVGAVVGSTIGLASTVAQDLTNQGSSEGPDPISNLPDGVNKCLDSFKELFKKKQQMYLSQLSKAEKMLDDLKDVTTIVVLKKKINDIQSELNAAVEKAASGDQTAIGKSYEAKKDLNASMTETLEKLAKEKETSSSQKSKFDKCINVVSKIQNIVQIADIGLDIYDKVTDAKSAIRTVQEALAKNAEHIEKLKEYEKAIYSTMLPLAEGIKDKVDNAVKASAGQSHAALDVSSWRVQSAIRNVKTQLKDMTAGFKTQAKIMDTADNVIYGMTTMAQVYDSIQDYYDRAQLADYISDITSSRASSIQVSDKSLQSAIDELRFRMHDNFVLSQYEKSMSAIRQYVFPFGNSTEEYNLPIEFQVGNTSHTVAEVINNIGIIFESLGKYVTVIQSDDENVFPKQIFNSHDNRNPPFYVWKYNNVKDHVRQLFQGKEVMLNADILKGFQENAVKLDRVGVHFKAKCSQIQTGLDEALDGVSIKLVHLGNSYYRCGHRIFMLTHGNIGIQHSVNMQADGEYFNQNEAYEKITTNDPLLSPYGMWKMKLIGPDYSKLEKFIGHTVDIELEGRGRYLNHNEDEYICTDDMRQYYEEVTESTIFVDDSVEEVDSGDAEECENQETQKTKPNSSFWFMNPVKNVGNMFSLGKSFHTTPIHNNNNPSDSQFDIAGHPHWASDKAQIPQSVQSANHNMVDVNGTLLLLDLLVRRVTGNPAQRTKINTKDEDYAHRLAYRAQAP